MQSDKKKTTIIMYFSTSPNFLQQVVYVHVVCPMKDANIIKNAKDLFDCDINGAWIGR